MARMTIAGHSVHAIINDWPIGLFTTSLAFDALALVTGKRAFAQTGYYMLASGVATGAAAAVTGIADYKALDDDEKVNRLANRHMGLNVAIMIFQSAALVLRTKQKEEVQALPFGLSAVSNALTILSAWYGDEMVYGHGVRVRDIHLKEGDREIRPPGDKKIVETLYAGI